ncbi:hypothetical protein [Tolypothrix sp. VBCCA 56010]|uniref:hypothetical protein n=1 Tax=Tolypothrix sp. VBCCA 56010 TaxID=3137731 RepID=UPI003D7CFD1D
MVNLDTVSAVAFIAEGSVVRYLLRQYIQEQQMVMKEDSFQRIYTYCATNWRPC